MKLVNAPDRIIFEGDIEAELTNSPNTGSALSNPNAFIFNVEPTAQEINELKITLKYDRTGGETVFGLFLQTPLITVGSLFTVTVFGQVTFDVYARATVLFVFGNIYAISNDLTQDTVVIYLKGNLI